MKRYLVCFRNRKNEILSQSCYAKNQSNLIEKLKLDRCEILSITKLDKNFKEN